MKTTRFLPAAAAALLTLTLIPIRARADPPQYRVVDLGTLGGDSSQAFGINNAGQVVGESVTVPEPEKGISFGRTRMGQTHAVRWTGTTPEDLGTLGGGASHGYSINASGQVAGYSHIDVKGKYNRADYFHAVRWTERTPEDAGDHTDQYSAACGINDAGQLAGNYGPRAARWTGTKVEELDGPADKDSHGFGINASGQVAGYSHPHAVRWTGQKAEILGSLGGYVSRAYGINDAGQVAGNSCTTGNRATHAVRWTGTTPTDLGHLGGNFSYGYGINAAGDVVGMSDLPDSKIDGGKRIIHAFLYTGGKMYDVIDLLVPGSGVTGLYICAETQRMGNCINDHGQIAITGTIGGKRHALRLDPVAKP